MKINEFGQIVGEYVQAEFPLQCPLKKSMTGNFCVLEKLDIEQHGKLLFNALSFENNGESWTYLPYGPFESYADFESWLRRVESERDTTLYVILAGMSNTPVGICGYLRINPDHGVIEIGHVHFSKLLKQTPAATEAMYLMMSYIFDELKYRRYEWKCNALNEDSKKAAARLGFKFEGVFRQSNVFKGRNRDTAWFSILDNEWPVLKARFEKWLNKTNFDLHERQKLSLLEC